MLVAFQNYLRKYTGKKHFRQKLFFSTRYYKIRIICLVSLLKKDRKSSFLVKKAYKIVIFKNNYFSLGKKFENIWNIFFNIWKCHLNVIIGFNSRQKKPVIKETILIEKSMTLGKSKSQFSTRTTQTHGNLHSVTNTSGSNSAHFGVYSKKRPNFGRFLLLQLWKAPQKISQKRPFGA